MSWLTGSWPWYISGIGIGVTLPLLYILGGRALGISSSFRHIGAICTPPRLRVNYLRYNWRLESWNLVFIVGVMLGSFIAVTWLTPAPYTFLPESYHSVGGAITLLIGGLLIGFGTRYAGGCTSGHTITGIANLNWPSMVATICFLIGGLIMMWTVGQWIF